MPRVKLVNGDDHEARILETIEGRMGALKIGRPELASRSGIKYRTLCNRMERPGDFRLSELAAINRVLRLSADQKAEIIG